MSRGKLVLSVAIPLCVLALVGACIATYEWGESSAECIKCGLGRRSQYTRILGLRVRHSSTLQYCGTPELQAKQHTCSHRFYGRGNSGGTLRPRVEAHSPIAWMHGMALESERHRYAIFRDAVLSLEQSPHANNYAWFIQEATAKDFGVTWDDSRDEPMASTESVAKILDWWKTQGREAGVTASP